MTPDPTTSATLPRPSPAKPARALAGLRIQLIRNGLQIILAGSRLRTGMVVACSAVFWTTLFILFFEGFQFLDKNVGATNEITEYLFGMFFLSLLILLVFSTGIITYSGLFHSREATYLLTTPAPADQVFAFKFAEAMAFSSWGFLLLGSPMMVAYGITAGASASFYFVFLAYLIGFVLIPGSLGAIGAILIANYMPRRAKTSLAILLVITVAAAAFVGIRMLRTPGETLSREFFDSLIGQLAFSQHPLLPSTWLSRGLIGAARNDWTVGLFYLMTTTAHAGLAYLLAAVAARDLYRRGYSRVQGGQSSRKRTGRYWIDDLFHRIFFFLPRTIRLLILKDLRTFRRDPAQWSQFLIFFGLLTFYFLNIRRLGYGDDTPPWQRNLLSFMNLAVTALILSTFTTRFIFPLLSLEGRNLWVLGLLPLRREAILWGKFAFSAGISLFATELLVILSDLMLKVGTTMIAVHIVMVAILCLGLSGISVGLGARLPNLREEDPSKIASGFGGTLNLLVSLVFIALVVAALALPSQLYFVGAEVNDMPYVQALVSPDLRAWMGVSISVSLVLGAIATIVPLRMGIKAFQKMEY